MKEKKKAALVDSVSSMPGIQLPRREPIHLPSLKPHPQQHNTSPPPISISITYTRTTPTQDTPPNTLTVLPIDDTLPQSPPLLCATEITDEKQLERTRCREDRSVRPTASCHGGALAPAAMRAANTHKLRPIRSTTYLQGQSIVSKQSVKS